MRARNVFSAQARSTLSITTLVINTFVVVPTTYRFHLAGVQTWVAALRVAVLTIPSREDCHNPKPATSTETPIWIKMLGS